MGKQAQAVVRPTIMWQRGLGEGLREGGEAPVPTADTNWGAGGMWGSNTGPMVAVGAKVVTAELIQW